MPERPTCRHGRPPASGTDRDGLGSGAGPRPIAVMIGQLSQGGSERQLYLFLARCDRRLWAPTLYVSGELGFWEAPIRALGVPVVLLTGSAPLKLLRFRAAVRRQRPVAFFSWSSYTNPFALALVGLGTHRVGSFRNSLFSDLPERGRALWARASVAGLSLAVCNSRETHRALAARGGASAYVPNGVEPIPAAQAADWRRAWRERLGLGPEEILVVGVGRLVPQKNFARFLDVVARVGRDRPVRAAIAGADLGCLPDLRDRAARLGLDPGIAFVGSVPDARALICAADIFLLSSDHEGMPNVVLEAMAAGVPCVATPVNAIADILRHGETGFVAGFGTEALAEAVARLAGDADLRRRMGEAARAQAARAHDPARLADALWRLCDPGAARSAAGADAVLEKYT